MKKKSGIYVTLYRVVQAYGGPEEGGWWYDCYVGEIAYHIPAGSQQQRKIRKALKDVHHYASENPGYYSTFKEHTLWSHETKEAPIYE